MEVKFEQINKIYGGSFYAVKDFSLTIKSGSLHFLLGPSGCGKTTSLRILAGLETPSNGRLLFNGKDVTNIPASERGIGMVFQNYALWPHMTVRKNIEYGLKLRKLSNDDLKKRVDEVLSFTQLTNFAHRFPGQLSGGQQQRVALARALAIRPNVLLLDEPLSNLDAKLRLEMRDNISRIHKQTGITTVYVTHDQKEALSMGTSISIMHAGKLIQTGTPRNLYHNPINSFIASFIGETNLLDGIYEGREGHYHKVRTSLGLLTTNHSVSSFNKGEKLCVSIRPEAFKVDFGGQKPQAEVNHFNLSLDHLTYLGESEQFQFSLEDKHRLKVNAFNPPEHSFVEGSKISLSVVPEDILLLPPQAEMGPGT